MQQLKIRTRAEAKSLNLARYYTGKHCINNHLCERTTSSGACTICDREHKLNWRLNNIVKQRECEQNYKAKFPRIRDERMNLATPKWAHKCVLSIDHIVPISGITPNGDRVSGLNVPWNLQIISFENNLKKGNRMTERCYRIACSLQHEI